ncbi:hypothetical protein ACHAWO_001040 [Cyclotella atomus]|uniref:Uncharacterized protein n=1 Tax=Cyclotella atomus TaxID=382360 RepID=A0ABD3PPL9_9STRA
MSLILITSSLLTSTHSFTAPHPKKTRPHTSLPARPLPPPNNNNKPSWLENAEYWAEQEALQKLQSNQKPTKPARNKVPAPAIGDHIGGTPVDRSPWDEGGNTFAHLYNAKSTDEFKLPFENQPDIVERLERTNASVNQKLEYRRDVTENGGVPEWFGKGGQQQQEQLSDGFANQLWSAHDVVNQLNGASPSPKQLKGTTDALSNPYGEGNKRHSFQTTSRDDFRRPYDGQDRAALTPDWFGSNSRIVNKPAVNAQQLPDNTNSMNSNAINNANANPYGQEGKRHAYQISTTDDFRQPYGSTMPNPTSQQNNNNVQQPPPKRVFKSPFQISTTEDFKRISDTGTSPNAPQQPIYAEFTKTSNRGSSNSSPAWKNSVGQDAYESTQLPNSKPLGGRDTNGGYRTNPSQSAAVLTIDENRVVNNQVSKTRSGGDEMLVRSIQWNDPSNDTAQYPQLLTRVCLAILATASTRYLHLVNGFSPVLAASSISFLISTCYDKRLGQVVLCGALAGMSGGHLMPDNSMALLLGLITSVCYEVLIGMSNLFAGIGGRIGGVAFLATSIMAKYRRVGGVGRKLRRGLWKSGVGPSSIAVSMIAFHVIGALATILLRQASEEDGAADPVRASSVVGILGSLFIADPTALMALYGGSFVGMSLPSRLSQGYIGGSRIRQSATSILGSFAGSAAIAGLIHAITIHFGYWNGGWGGKAGLCAFAGCWVYRGLDNLIRLSRK